MPVGVKKVGGKYRIVHDDGSIVTRAGGAVDGGGHDSETHARKQAAAINASLHKQGKI